MAVETERKTEVFVYSIFLCLQKFVYNMCSEYLP